VARELEESSRVQAGKFCVTTLNCGAPRWICSEGAGVSYSLEDHFGSLRVEWLACVTAAFAWISLTNRGSCKT